jgi:CrcB protein
VELGNYLFVTFGGALGALSRYIIVILAAKFLGSDFPYGTLFVNVLGSFLLSFFMFLALEKLTLSSSLRLLISTGFFGSFTTLSSVTYETILIAQTGDFVKAIINIFLNFFISLVVAFFGFLLSKII